MPGEGGVSPEEAGIPEAVNQTEQKVNQLTQQLLTDINLPELPEPKVIRTPRDSFTQDIITRGVNQFLKANPQSVSEQDTATLLNKMRENAKTSNYSSTGDLRFSFPSIGADYRMLEALTKYAMSSPDGFGGKEDIMVGALGVVDKIKNKSMRENWVSKKDQIDPNLLKDNAFYHLYDKLPRSANPAVRTR